MAELGSIYEEDPRSGARGRDLRVEVRYPSWALGDADGAAALRARARRIRARLQEREGAVALWLARGRSECVNNPVEAPRTWDPLRALERLVAG